MDILSNVADRQTATGDVGLVQAFVNTIDLQDGPEELPDPNTLKVRLVAKGLLDASLHVDASDLKHAIALREAIRSVIGANSGSKVYPVDIATLNEAALGGGLVQGGDVDGVDLRTGVGADHRPDRLTQGDRVFQIRRIDVQRGIQQSLCNQPHLEGVWVSELLRTGLLVDCVDKGLHEPDVAGSGLSVCHIRQYIDNLLTSIIGYTNHRN